jgi:glycine/D-amino acid oxidase-like deaminating enzyme
MRHDACGYWLHEAGPIEPTASLTDDARADVVVIGGGYAGLWTAWEISRLAPEAQVVVLEARTCGEGPSGRNAGFVSALWHRLGSLAERFGDAGAVAIAEAAAASVDAIGAWSADEEVDVWFRKAGHLEAATSLAQEGRWTPSVDTCQRLGAGAEYRSLDAAAVQARCASPLFRSGAFMPQGATVQPARLVRGLRAVLLQRGVRICEHSRATSLSRGHGGDVIVETVAGGSVRARAAVIAINAASAGFAPLSGRLTVTSTHMVITEPVRDVLEAIGWTGAECITDARTYVHYFRTTPDGRIAFGWGGGRIAFGARLGRRVEQDRAVVGRVREDLLRCFPGLAGRRIEHAWGGPVDVSPNRLPVIGSLPGGGVHYAYGFTGNGVGPCHLAGRVLARLALDVRDELTRLRLVEPELARVPPEPLRYIGGTAVRAALIRKERLEDAGAPVDPATRFVVDMPRRFGIHIGR